MKILLGTKEYPQLIRNHRKDPEQMLADLHPLKVEVLHTAIEVATSAAELLSIVKRCTLEGGRLDTQGIIDKLGMIEFSLEQLRQVLEIQRDGVLTNNMAMVQQKYTRGEEK
jgi:hypothetical protein